MFDRSDKRPGEDILARILDWAGLSFGLGVLIIFATYTIQVH
ncbi:hypothetical protein [Microvirga rosea]|nr:hypothetical protein [Microvirga rosea]